MCGRCCYPLQKARTKRSTELTIYSLRVVGLSQHINFMAYKHCCVTESFRKLRDGHTIIQWVRTAHCNSLETKMRSLPYVLSLVCCIPPTLGNVEKTIFLGPEAIIIPQYKPDLDSLNLQSLTPTDCTLRRQLHAEFPTSGKPKGTEAWFLINGLRPRQRYEVRICWAATVCSSHHESMTSMTSSNI